VARPAIRSLARRCPRARCEVLGQAGGAAEVSVGKFKIRYLVVKPQKGGHALFYWQPAHTLPQLGFDTRRLAEQTNRLEDAVVEAEQLNRELDRWRSGSGEPIIEPGSLPWLVKLYRNTELYADLAPKTQRSYEQGIVLLETWSKERDHPPISGLQTRHVRELLETVDRPAMRHLAYRTLRLLLSFAVAEGHIERNPARGLRIKSPRPRETYWTAEQVEAFNKTARARGRPSLALAAYLAVSLGQREGDVLRLAWSQYEAGSFTLRQRKTGRLVSVPATAELSDVLAAAARKSPTIVIAETTGRPYREDHFRHEFAASAHSPGCPPRCGSWIYGALRWCGLRKQDAPSRRSRRSPGTRSKEALASSKCICRAPHRWHARPWPASTKPAPRERKRSQSWKVDQGKSEASWKPAAKRSVSH
jgi:integrase